MIEHRLTYFRLGIRCFGNLRDQETPLEENQIRLGESEKRRVIERRQSILLLGLSNGEKIEEENREFGAAQIPSEPIFRSDLSPYFAESSATFALRSAEKIRTRKETPLSILTFSSCVFKEETYKETNKERHARFKDGIVFRQRRPTTDQWAGIDVFSRVPTGAT